MIVPAIVGALAYFQAGSQTPQYRATTEILVREARRSLIGPSDPMTNEELANTYARLATTSSLRSQGRQELGLTELPTIKASGSGPIFRISADGPNPEVTRDVANRLAELLILHIQTSQLLDIGQLESLAQSQGISVSREILQAQLTTIDSLRIIEPAPIPSSPFAPTPARNTVFGVPLGLVLGSLIVGALDFLNKNIQSVEQAEKLFGASNITSSTIGVIFRWKSREVQSSQLAVRDDPTSVYAEMFRQLRTDFQFVRVVHDSKAFLITSAAPLEGKTTIASTLAVVLAQGGSRVILLDADLQRPNVHRVFDLSGPYSDDNYQGLSSLLIDASRPESEELVDVGVPGPESDTQRPGAA